MRGHTVERAARRRRRRRPVRRALLSLLVVALLAAAAFAAGAVWWSGATLRTGGSALAKLELQPLAGSLVSARAVDGAGRPVRIAVDHGRVLPRTPVVPGTVVRVAVVIKRPGWLSWLLGSTRHEELQVRAPVAEVADRWPTLRPGSPLRVRFTTAVSRVAYGRSVPAHPAVADGRTASLGRQRASGTLVIAAAARPWERLGKPEQVTWFPPTRRDAVRIAPTSGTITPLLPIRLTFAHAVSAVLGSARPRLVPAIAGSWREPDSHTLVFEPKGDGYPLGGSVRLELPRLLSVAGDRAARDTRSLAYSVPPGSILRLHELLAQEGYLPVDWQPSGADVPREHRAELSAAVDPPQGTFSWRFPNTPPQLQRLWKPTLISQITRGAVMMFEHDHGLTVDALAGPHVWHALIADAIAGKRRTDGYSYVYVHTHLPQLLTLWHNGKVVLTSPGNTGIPAAPTQPGTYPVFEHIPVGEMQGTNPDGTHYDDKGIRWISYFHGGEALHAFNRASFGTPQSLGCVELPLDTAARVWPYTPIGTLVTIEN